MPRSVSTSGNGGWPPPVRRPFRWISCPAIFFFSFSPASSCYTTKYARQNVCYAAHNIIVPTVHARDSFLLSNVDVYVYMMEMGGLSYLPRFYNSVKQPVTDQNYLLGHYSYSFRKKYNWNVSYLFLFIFIFSLYRHIIWYEICNMRFRKILLAINVLWILYHLYLIQFYFYIIVTIIIILILFINKMDVMYRMLYVVSS